MQGVSEKNLGYTTCGFWRGGIRRGRMWPSGRAVPGGTGRDAEGLIRRRWRSVEFKTRTCHGQELAERRTAVRRSWANQSKMRRRRINSPRRRPTFLLSGHRGYMSCKILRKHEYVTEILTPCKPMGGHSRPLTSGSYFRTRFISGLSVVPPGNGRSSFLVAN